MTFFYRKIITKISNFYLKTFV